MKVGFHVFGGTLQRSHGNLTWPVGGWPQHVVNDKNISQLVGEAVAAGTKEAIHHHDQRPVLVGLELRKRLLAAVPEACCLEQATKPK